MLQTASIRFCLATLYLPSTRIHLNLRECICKFDIESRNAIAILLPSSRRMKYCGIWPLDFYKDDKSSIIAHRVMEVIAFLSPSTCEVRSAVMSLVLQLIEKLVTKP